MEDCDDDVESNYVPRFRVRKGSRFSPRARLWERIWAKRRTQVFFVTSTARFNRDVKCAQRWKSGTFGYAMFRPAGKKIIIPMLRGPIDQVVLNASSKA